MKRLLAHIMSPANFIAAMAAAEHLHAGQDMAMDLLLAWPGAGQAMTADLAGLLRQLAGGFPAAGRLFALTGDDERLLMAQPSAGHAAQLLRVTLRADYDEILYAHDVVGNMPDLLELAWPGARKVCYGDAFGNVYEREVHLGLLGVEVPPHPWFSRRMPDVACLALPVDQSGNYLPRVRLEVVPARTLAGVLDRCREAHRPLARYQTALLRSLHGRPKVLLLTENGAEGGFINLEQEARMYAAMVADIAAPGSVIIVKPHPGETIPREEAFRQAFAGYELVHIDPAFRRVPVEVMRPLVEACDVACLSYPVLSLRYLFGKQVHCPMSEAFIERWYAPAVWDSYKNCIDLYLEPLAALMRWDGRGPLWSGRVPPRLKEAM